MCYESRAIYKYENGYIENKEEMMKKIVKKNPDICLVAMGIPVQEKLIATCMKEAKKGIYIGVGGSFDVLSGTKKRAPKLFIKLKLAYSEYASSITTNPFALSSI